MTDRQLLQAAAKAAGVPVHDSDDGTVQRRPILALHHMVQGQPYGEHEWNPLTDDRDALRLAVKLRIVVQHAPRYVVAIFTDGQREIACHEDGGNPYAATRRAIVRAAAAIGESKP